ncbi:MAG: TonB family protein [Candidatus Firestonebacteria bacterium]|nr:TonB family protein [Candidatus Firestonebacteria bacterium]
MFLDRPNWRIQITVVGSLIIHGAILSYFSSGKIASGPTKLKLTEVEYQEEASKPTEVEKLMNKMTAPPKPTAPSPRQTAALNAALAELEHTSFSKVVGVHAARPALDKISEADLKHLAALPKLKIESRAPAPNLAPVSIKKLELVRRQSSPEDELTAKVVPDELPPADFGPDISRRGFQAPEMIIKKVKAERKLAAPAADKAKHLSLSRDTLISGEVKNREILHREAPVMPRWLEEKGVEVEVVISFVVNPDGEVGDRLYVEKTSGYAELDRLAIDALKKYEFSPLPLNVKQAEQKGTIVIRFTFQR